MTPSPSPRKMIPMFSMLLKAKSRLISFCPTAERTPQIAEAAPRAKSASPHQEFQFSEMHNILTIP